VSFLAYDVTILIWPRWLLRSLNIWYIYSAGRI